MADGREIDVWTKHAQEHRSYTKPYSQSSTDGNLLKWLQEIVPYKAKVLDYGCGSGLWKSMFKNYNYKGVDQNSEMIQVARERFPTESDCFSQITWNKLPFPNQTFDLIFTASVLQHNKHVDKVEILNEFKRILVPDGYLMFSENTFREDNFRITFPKIDQWVDTLDDGYSLTPNGWTIFIERLGFQRLNYQDPGEYLFTRVGE